MPDITTPLYEIFHTHGHFRLHKRYLYDSSMTIFFVCFGVKYFLTFDTLKITNIFYTCKQSLQPFGNISIQICLTMALYLAIQRYEHFQTFEKYKYLRTIKLSAFYTSYAV
jgi:hypothetical protein